MLPKRIIARVDIKGPDAIKSVRFEGVRKVGKPEALIAKYASSGADEIILIDAVSSLFQRPTSFDVMRRCLENVWLPVTLGGGFKSLSDMEIAFRSGADKVALNTAAVSCPDLLDQAVKAFGSQSVIASVVAKKVAVGKWQVRTDNAREHTEIDVVEWCRRLSDIGVGEILLSSVDHDGMKRGMEIDLLKAIAGTVDVPLIAYGGIGKPEHVKEAFSIRGVDALAVSTALHYGFASIEEMREAISV